MRGQRIANELEVVVQKFQHFGGRQPLVEAGEVAHVREPQDGADLLAFAAPDRAFQHALADLTAEIGARHGIGDTMLDMHLHDGADHVDQAGQILDVEVAEAAPAIRREADDRQRAVACNRHGRGEVVGAAVGLELLQQGVILVGDLVQPVTHWATLLADFLDRTPNIGRRKLDAVGTGDRLDVMAATPRIAHRRELRMDELQAGIETPNRQARLNHLLHQLLDEGRR